MKSKAKILAIAMVVVIILFGTSVLLYTNVIENTKSNADLVTEEMKETQFKSIWMYLELLQEESKKEVTEVSKNIESDLLSLSEEELKQIQLDMNNGVHNITLHNVIMHNVESVTLNGINNYRNGIIVMNPDGIMEDFNYRRAHPIHEFSSFRTWEDSIETSFNPILEQDAINKILNRTSQIIALESYNLLDNNNHIMIKELNYESLLNVYLNEGIEGLRNYQILVPYYITDIGDIFGVPDISQGMLMDNNKIIVVQEFNLYDQIKAGNIDLIDDGIIKNHLSQTEHLLNHLRICGLALIMSTVGMLIFCTMYYNKIVLEEEIKQLKIESDKDNSIEDE